MLRFLSCCLLVYVQRQYTNVEQTRTHLDLGRLIVYWSFQLGDIEVWCIQATSYGGNLWKQAPVICFLCEFDQVSCQSVQGRWAGSGFTSVPFDADRLIAVTSAYGTCYLRLGFHFHVDGVHKDITFNSQTYNNPEPWNIFLIVREYARVCPILYISI